MSEKIIFEGENYLSLAKGVYEKNNQHYLLIGNSYKDGKKEPILIEITKDNLQNSKSDLDDKVSIPYI
jgi:hypothetical protein